MTFTPYSSNSRTAAVADVSGSTVNTRLSMTSAAVRPDRCCSGPAPPSSPTSRPHHDRLRLAWRPATSWSSPTDPTTPPRSSTTSTSSTPVSTITSTIRRTPTSRATATISCRISLFTGSMARLDHLVIAGDGALDDQVVGDRLAARYRARHRHQRGLLRLAAHEPPQSQDPMAPLP